MASAADVSDAVRELNCAAGNATKVLVTGASGFIASHVCRMLLALGYRVRGTVRSLKDTGKFEHLQAMPTIYPIELVEADLTQDKGWAEAVAGCEFVIHTASPYFRNPKLGDDFFLPPAVDGTRRVLSACASARVKRVVLTSSIAAQCFGLSNAETLAHGPFTEKDWTVSAKAGPYQKSKTEAERAAWAFVEALPEDQRFELVTILPAAVVGTMLSKNPCESQTFAEHSLNHVSPGVPFVEIHFVDVFDVALAHVRAMQTSAAAGQRFTVSNESFNWQELHMVLLAEFQPKGYEMATQMNPSDDGPFSIKRVIDTSKSQTVLGMKYRSSKDAIIAMGYSLIKWGFVPDKLKH